MSAKLTPQAAKLRKQKLIVIIGGVSLAIVMAIEIPWLMKKLHPPQANAAPVTTSVAPAAPAPGGTPLPAATVPDGSSTVPLSASTLPDTDRTANLVRR